MPVTYDDLDLARAVVGRFRRWHADWDWDDLESDAMFGLDRAVRKWDTGEIDPDLARSAFLVKRVRAAIIDGLRTRNGRAKNGFKKQRFEQSMLRLDKRDGSSQKQHKETLGDRVGSDDDDLEKVLEDGSMLKRLEWLPRREREIIERTVLGDETLWQVGRDWGVTESRASQVRTRAFHRLRHGDPEIEARQRELERRRPQPSLPGFGLTPRELEVLQGVADGLRNEDIAKEIFIGHETVKSHIRHILAKMQVASRTHAVATALRHNMIT